MSLRNDLAILDDTFLLKGGLSNIMLRLRLFIYIYIYMK